MAIIISALILLSIILCMIGGARENKAFWFCLAISPCLFAIYAVVVYWSVPSQSAIDETIFKLMGFA